MSGRARECLDCLIVGGGPAGLTAALYLARYRRRAVVIDAGDPRAAWIPKSHNLPMFADGISGRDLLDRQRDHALRYGAELRDGVVEGLEQSDGDFVAQVKGPGGREEIRARRVILATGAIDVEPDLPGLPQAVRRGIIRYCPICDGYEVQGKRIAVIGHGAQGLGEAVFVARSYSRDVTLLTLSQGVALDEDQHRRLREHGIKLVREPIVALEPEGDGIGAFRMHGGEELRFDVLYSALGLQRRSDLALALGAGHDGNGALRVDEHNRTSVKRLYAVGGVVRGLDQILVAMGQAAIAATDVHNRCELPTEDEADAP
jgi:thioredoxin reductase (NADPH)